MQSTYVRTVVSYSPYLQSPSTANFLEYSFHIYKVKCLKWDSTAFTSSARSGVTEPQQTYKQGSGSILYLHANSGHLRIWREWVWPALSRRHPATSHDYKLVLRAAFGIIWPELFTSRKAYIRIL